MMTVTAFEAWLKTAKPRAAFTYWVGGSARLGPLNDAVRGAYNAGRITLVQARIDHGHGPLNHGSVFEYRAVMLAEPRIPGVLFAFDNGY